MPTSVSLLLGTTKGAFVLSGGEERRDWALSGPHCGGWTINHVLGDPVTGTLWAGGGSDWSGAGVWRSNDGAETWTLHKLSKGQIDDWAANDPKMAEMMHWQPVDTPFDGAVGAVWSLHLAQDALYAGTRPAQLLRSRDGGVSWEMTRGLSEFPDRDAWNPGAAGLVLHTIVSDPKQPEKLWLGISAAGVFASEDSGASWERRNRMSNADACVHHDHPAAPQGGETGHCVHNIVRADNEDLLYQQNHHGVFRSADGGRSWDDITPGLPSTFGFPIAVHPHDRDTLWVLPLNGDTEGRFPPDASAAVWKSADSGQTWHAKRQGLPQDTCFFTVLRQAMATDRRAQAGVYFGTNSGSVFASIDEGETWDEIARHLPTVLSVEVLER